MIKTLFISAWYPNRYDEMFGLFVRKHAEAVSLYCDVQVLYVHPSSDIRHFETEIHQSGKLKETIVYFPASKSGVFSKLLKQINFLRAYFKGWRMLQKSGFRPDIVHANILTRTGLVAYGIHLFTRIPYVITEHWTRYLPLRKSYNGLLRKKITEFVVKHAAAVFPVSENLKNAMISNKLWNRNYFVINNTVDDVFLTKVPKVSETKKIILHVSCFDEQQKNVKGLLNSLKALSINRSDFKMIFIGTGVDFKEVVDYCVKLNFPEDVIHFVGEKNPAEVAEYMKNADFFVLFSNYENSPVVISESLVCGKPVISTDVGGIAEHINETNGILIPARDEKMLLESLNFMLDHFQDYDAEKLSKEAVEKFSMKNVGKTIVEQYEKILGKNPE